MTVADCGLRFPTTEPAPVFASYRIANTHYVVISCKALRLIKSKFQPMTQNVLPSHKINFFLEYLLIPRIFHTNQEFQTLGNKAKPVSLSHETNQGNY